MSNEWDEYLFKECDAMGKPHGFFIADFNFVLALRAGGFNFVRYRK